ncbi:MAG: nitrogen fixation protein NifZ [Nevskiales bacterium]|nr:nitrogen fixation protein NifZ [Nevskiales bacterium]
MIDLQEPRFEWGQRVSARADLYNDGGFPDQPPDARLVQAGEHGEIVQVGMHEQSRTPLYLVEFAVGVVGCLEDELEALLPGVSEPMPPAGARR